MAGLRLFGPCPTCGMAFESRDKKRFCSMNCYHRSSEFKNRMALMAQSQRVHDPRKCPGCGESFIVKPSSGRTYCSRLCQRKWFAERHDRWVANPQKIALPQSFDEFLTQGDLRCLIEGCDWVGSNLSTHANTAHGISASALKELAGFNKSTGLVSPDLHKRLCDRPYEHLADHEKVRANMEKMRLTPPKQRSLSRLEHKEHSRKRLAERRATAPSKSYTCAVCSVPFEALSLRRILYCEPCKPVVRRAKIDALSHQLQCVRCKSNFLGNSGQKRKSDRGRPVVCSMACRSQRNLEIAHEGLARKMLTEKKLPPMRGPCPTCGNTFRHYSPIKYCARSCYLASDGYKQKMIANLQGKKSSEKPLG